jgi:RNA polymerase sigma-70 factor (ECF subfamily)
MDDAPGQERNADDRELLEQALARLEPDLRAVFVLREVESRSYREMAEILGISDGTVASRLNRARRILRDYLIDMGWDP